MQIYFFILGAMVGSFCNVCIVRLPMLQSVVNVRSHCMVCNKRIKILHMIPVLSYAMLGGKCKYCSTKIPIQYPIVEIINGILWLIVFNKFSLSFQTMLVLPFVSALLVLSVIDEKTCEIPPQIIAFTAVISAIKTLTDLQNIISYILGFIAVSTFLLCLYYFTNGRAIGGGDIKLMAICGLFLGLKLVMFAFITACFIGSVVHLIRMKFYNAPKTLAMGPYLSIGVFIAIMWGEELINNYNLLLGIKL